MLLLIQLLASNYAVVRYVVPYCYPQPPSKSLAPDADVKTQGCHAVHASNRPSSADLLWYAACILFVLMESLAQCFMVPLRCVQGTDDAVTYEVADKQALPASSPLPLPLRNTHTHTQ
jgi:hypothetical protein